MIYLHNFKWLALLFVFVSSGCTLADSRRSIAFIVPTGYVGWIRVKYNVAGAPPLPVAKGRYIAHLPANGLLKTSTIEEEGFGADKFYHMDKTGKKFLLIADGQNPNK